MKGVIVNCLQELVESKFGQEAWQEIRREAGIDPSVIFLPGGNVDEATIMKLLASTMSTAELTLPQAADAFGDHWVNTFAPKLYATYFRGATTAREFLNKLDVIHAKTAERMEGSQPPRFDCRWTGDRTLVLVYRSHRKLIDLVVGLAKGVGRYYGERLAVTKLNDTEIEIKFPE